MMKKQLLFLLVIISILSSCKQSAPKEEIGILTVGAMSSLDFVPIAVAKKMHFFEQNGVNVTIEKFYSANERDAAFQSGSIDGTVIDYTGAILQAAGGVQLQLTSACNAPFAIVAAPGSDIKTMNDLKGKKIAVSRNTVIDFCIDMALKSTNLTETDIEKVEINKIPLRLEMLMKGEIQATALPDPFLTIALSKGCPVLENMQNLGYQVTGIMFGKKAIEEKSKEIQAFYTAYNQGVDYIKTHSVDDIKELLINEVGFPEELLSQVKLPEYTHAQLPTDKDIQTTVDWLKQKNLIPADYSPKILDSQFIK